MALDTAEKRRSALDFGKFCGSGVPIPSGVISEAARAHILNLYGGILPQIGTIIFWRNKNRVGTPWASYGVPAGAWKQKRGPSSAWASKAAPSSSWKSKKGPATQWQERTSPQDGETQSI